MEASVSIPHWKRVWQTASTLNGVVHASEVVEEVLKVFEKYVVEGLSIYKPYTEEQMVEWLDNCPEIVNDNIYCKCFFKRICKALNLCPDVAWEVFCNYLVYEYFGKLTDLKLKILYEVHIIRIIQDIWNYFCSERMFFLKTLREILEHHQDSQHKYHTLYRKVINNVTPKKIFESIYTQFKYLIVEIDKAHLENCLDLLTWVHRNAREQQELAMLIPALSSTMDFTSVEFTKIIKLFVRYDFGLSPTHKESMTIDPKTLINVSQVELGAVLVMLEKWWNNPSLWSPGRDELIEIMRDMKSDRPANTLVWYILVKLMNLPDLLGENNMGEFEKKCSTVNFAELICNTLVKVVSSRQFEKSISGKKVLEATFTTFSSLYGKWNCDKEICMQAKAHILLEEFMKHKHILPKLFEPTQPLRRVFDFTFELFPFTFFTVSDMITSLLKHSCNEDGFVEKITTFESYTELYPYAVPIEGPIKLAYEYYPDPDSNIFCLKPGTQITGMHFFSTHLIRYRSTYNYFEYFTLELDAILNLLRKQYLLPEERIVKVVTGCDLLAEIIKQEIHNVIRGEPFSRCINALNVLRYTFSDDNYKDIRLFKAFFKVYSAMVLDPPYPMLMTDILPRMMIYEHKLSPDDLNQSSVHVWGVLPLFLYNEAQTSDHELVLDYVEFLEIAWLKELDPMEILLPGVIYMVRNIFVYHLYWDYNDIYQKSRITQSCLELLKEILTCKPTTPLQDAMQTFCQDLSLYDKAVVNVYIELFSITNLVVQKQLENEIDWHNGVALTVVNIMKTLFQNVVILIRSKERLQPITVLEHRLMTSKIHYVTPLKIISGFLNNVFSVSLQVLAVRVLTIMAEKNTRSLLSPLDLDDDQLKALFFDKIRDPIEDVGLRRAIIEMIIKIVGHQPELTRAFLGVDTGKASDKEKDCVGENLEGIVVDFLTNMQKAPTLIESPLQDGILELLHKLWIVGKSHLFRNVTRIKNFWTLLSTPLFQEEKINPDLIGRVMGIISMEIIQGHNKYHADLQQVLHNFFDSKKPYLKKSAALLLSVMMNKENATPGELSMLSAWRYFLGFVIDNLPSCVQDHSSRKIVVDTCLEALEMYFEEPNNPMILKLLMECYMITVNAWGDTSFSSPELVVERLTNILKMLRHERSVGASPHLWKTTFLCGLLKTIVPLQSYLESKVLPAETFMMHLQIHLSTEYNAIRFDHMFQVFERRLENWQLLLTIYIRLYSFKNLDECSFFGHDFAIRTWYFAAEFMRDPSTLKYAKIAVKALTAFIISAEQHDVQNVFFENCGGDVRPEEFLIDIDLLIEKDLNEACDWMETYQELIHFQNVLLERYGSKVKDECFWFLFTHHEFISRCIIIMDTTVDPRALSLSVTALRYINNLLKWKSDWIVKSEISFRRIMTAISMCLNCVSTVLVRPNCLKFYKVGDRNAVVTLSSVETDIMSTLLNKLLTCLMYVFSCLLKNTPGLMSVLELNNTQADPCISHDFSIPSIEDRASIGRHLSFGSLIYILHFLYRLMVKHNSELKGKIQDTSKSTSTTRYITSVHFNFLKFLTPTQKLKLMKAPELSEFSFLNGSWFPLQSPEIAANALELLLGLFMVKLHAVLWHRNIPRNVKEHVAREMLSEMNFFKESADKSLMEKCKAVSVSPESGVMQGSQRHLNMKRLSVHMKAAMKEKIEFREEFLAAVLNWMHMECTNLMEF